MFSLLALVQLLSTPVQANAGRPLDSTDVARWLDGRMPYALEQGDIAGAVVVVVKGGRILFEKGYGLADVARGIPVDPARTLFRVGSVSKLFTWTAVMQLVEQGKVDLDRDVNSYLDFTIPPWQGRPVTARNLLTHTPGFEEKLVHLASYDSTKVLGLAAYLASGTPKQIFPPGEVTAYSNFGAALAGRIVELVSGEAFADYVDRHILAPLAMEHSAFHQPLPPGLRPLMAKGYRRASGSPEPFEMIPAAPAGALTATGNDIARFMMAHLAGGAYQSTRILGAETARLMHDTPHTVVPAVHRMLLGFYENDQNGRRVIAHGGDTQWFHSELQLFVDDSVGLFVAVNSTGRDGAAWDVLGSLIRQFSERYLPGHVADGTLDSATAVKHARLMAGRYDGSVRYPNFFSLLQLVSQRRVDAHADGTITVTGFDRPGGGPRRWREIAPFVWRDVEGGDRLGAKVTGGRVVMFSADETSTSTVFLPAPWWRSSLWLVPALVISLGVLTLTLAWWPVSAVLRGRYRTSSNALGDQRVARTNGLAALAVVGTFAGFAATIVTMISDFTLLTPKLNWWIAVLHGAAVVAFVGGAAMTLKNVSRQWVGSRLGLGTLWSAGAAVACLVMLWVAAVFNLIGMSLQY